MGYLQRLGLGNAFQHLNFVSGILPHSTTPPPLPSRFFSLFVAFSFKDSAFSLENDDDAKLEQHSRACSRVLEYENDSLCKSAVWLYWVSRSNRSFARPGHHCAFWGEMDFSLLLIE